ncbi:hypothetical protein [Kozakia baliensis]|uniref:hypothetical protein n=1 Tax=Kozakia baliensis TaxID=153496 RepID=UPI001362C0A5|nr:hypothetical protein [Kozakia baliensis]
MSPEAEICWMKAQFAASVPLVHTGQPKEIAATILFVGADAASFISSQILAVSL